MARAATAAAPEAGGLPVKDMQGLIVSSFSKLPCAAFVLYQIEDTGRARRWLSRLAPDITTAVKKDEHRSTCVAFTESGLRRSGLTPDAMETFPHAFRDGMATKRRSRILGDLDASSPANWKWGRLASPVDILLLVYSDEEAALAKEIKHRRSEAPESGLRIVDVLTADRQPDSREHFGFQDGVGQPAIKGSPAVQRQLDQTGHVTELEPGEIILGHPDEYGQLAPSPDVADSSDTGRVLPLSPTSGRRDLGRNGTYLVFRQMDQHVAGFWSYLDKATRTSDGQPDAVARDRLAAKMVGRWPSGASMVAHPDADPNAGTGTLVRENDFEYAATDLDGSRVPIGSHIRRANPRDSLGPDPDTALKSVRRHRLLRRGRLYGERSADRAVDDGKQRGLYFICLNSDLERQFEFVQQTWINGRVFGGQYLETDPLVGDQSLTGGVMTIQGEPVRQRIHGMSRFVTVIGGAYFFLPSIPALHYLANLKDPVPTPP